jgi:chromosome partitioning protein
VNRFDDAIYETDWGFDFAPSHTDMEMLDTRLKDVPHGDKRLLKNFLTPLITNDIYDYVVIDGGGERSKIADNAFAAARQTIIPVEPGSECLSGFKKTLNRVVAERRQYQPFRLLAIVPNKISHRIDQHSKDRELIEHLNTSERYREKVPRFARISEEEFEQIDAGEVDELPKPGIRKSKHFSAAYDAGMPISEHAPDSDVISHLDELAAIVERGGVQ